MPTMKLADLSQPEKEAFAALIRLLVRADSAFSADEAAELRELASEVGESEFDALMEDAATWEDDEDDVKQRATAVERQDIREEIYGALYVIATSGGTDERENDLLDWLAETWNLEISQNDPG